MENTAQNFEQILQKQCARKSSLIYQKNVVNQSNYTPQDVIETVNAQIKAIQSADSVKKCKENVRKCSFPTVSKAPVYKEVSKQSKFETQCILDTQLINIIENVEAIDAHEGMTQEFDSTFIHTDINDDITDSNDVKLHNIDENHVSVLFTDMNKERDEDITLVGRENDASNMKLDAINKESSGESNLLNKDVNLITPEPLSETRSSKETELIYNVNRFQENTNIDNKEHLNNSIELFTEHQTQFHEALNLDRSPSPVLIPKPKRKRKRSDTPPSFSVPLEIFENFEKTYMPLIDENSDTKIVINSQIIDKELCINMDESTDINRSQLSPILDISTDHLHVDKNDLKIFENDLQNKNVNTIKSNQDKSINVNKTEEDLFQVVLEEVKIPKDILPDEILFSSDEEEYIHKELEDLSLTCVLETSFYDEPGILEKTMYVGFQTASNKSIQIQTNSLEKAQSILNNSKEFNLTELVDIYDKSLNLSKDIINKPKSNSASDVNEETDVKTENVESTANINEDLTRITHLKSKEQMSIGFKTGNNSKINISDRAKAKIRDVFKDIDLNDQYNNPTLTADGTVNKKSFVNDDILNKGKLHKENQEKDFIGFRAANNTKISISDKAKSKIRDVFKDIDLNDQFDDPAPTKDDKKSFFKDLSHYGNKGKEFSGFRTANNTEIKISDKAKAKISDVFKDIHLDAKFNDPVPTMDDRESLNNDSSSHRGDLTPNTEVNNENDVRFDENINDDLLIQEFENIEMSLEEKESKDSNKIPLEGFKTASNRKIEISDSALEKIKNVFQDIDLTEINNELCENVIQGIEQPNNKDDEPQKKGHIHKTHDIQDPCKPVNNLIDLSTSKAFQGFKTANNKMIKISDASMSKTKDIFKDIDTYDFKIKSRPPDIENNASSSTFEGFKTASNKIVKVSEQNLAKTRKIFENIESDCYSYKTEAYNPVIKDDNVVFRGFQTASNKPVKVSEQSLAKSRKLFESIETDTSNDVFYSKVAMEQNPLFKGFQTPSNKCVDISEKAILESKKIFQELNDDAFLLNVEPTTSFKGFKTSNNKEVLISENALAQSRIIFNDLAEPLSLKNETKSGFVGFQTASNKNVKISKEAIEKTKHLFKDIDNFETDIDKNVAKNPLLENTEAHKEINLQNKKPLTNLNIFTTASNKEVAISEESLAKSKELLKIPNEDAINTSIKTDNMSVNIENLINTQVINNFEDNLCTEDFRSPQLKRSTSPILSCPRAKKRKFETPYNTKKEIIEVIKNTVQKKNQTHFDKNYKKNKIFKLKDLKVIKNKPIDPYITEFNINNILDFEFKDNRNDLTANTDRNINIDRLKTIFIDGVDEKIIPKGWLDIQIKSILWKLLSYEVKYNFTCTASNLLDQLKYRYEKELFRVERSALRKIFEKDDVPSKTMILCVADIFVNGESVTNVTTTDNIELLLTDGWYFIKATIDKNLSKLVYDKKIVIGCKLATNGAELINCEQGVSPWEDITSIRLKIFYNSTRPAHFDARLGFCQSAILSQLSTVKVDGGKICKLRVFVTRVYPMLYVEKFEDGSTVTRSERLEHLHQIKYESEREAMLERIYEEVQKELSDQESQDSESYTMDSDNKIKVYDSGSQIAKMMKKSADPMEFRAQLTTSQIQLLQDHTSKYRDKMLSIIQDKMKTKFADRNVVPLARCKMADIRIQDGRPIVTTGMLSIWKPNDEIMELFKENSWIEIMNVTPTAIRYSEIQISAGRQSVFRQSKHNVDPSLLPHLEKLQRKVYKIEDLSKKSITDNEIDTVGLIFLIDPSDKEFDSTKQFQNIYLADEYKNMICINFWGGIKKFGYHNVIDTGQIISCSNLQRRAGNTRKNIPQFRVTEFTSITKTPKNLKSREIINELSKKLGTNRQRFCEDCIAIQNNYEVLKCFDENSPYRFNNNSDYNISKNKQFIDTPVRQNEFNLTGLDFESSFRQKDTQLSPKTLLRKKKVNERIAKLKNYGEPPPLSPINIMNKSKNATNSYKSPLISNNSSRSPKNIGRGHKMVEMCNSNAEATSPILNRTFVKRKSKMYNVNPIKLDFSGNSCESKDQFIEDFDASPPLSLD